MRRWKIDRVPVDRRGVVLILALGMLVLFTIVAVTLAAISKTAMTSAANFKRLEQFGSLRLDVPPEEVGGLFRFAMNQLIYDTRNKQSAIRGHSLLRDMYGGPDRYTVDPSGNILLQDVGAELRLKAIDAFRFSPDPGDPLRTEYYGVYNGTGVFLPRKIAFANLLAGAPTTDDLGLSDEEIALQTAYQHVPPSLGSFAMTKLPTAGLPPNQWASFFAPVFGAYPVVPGSNRLWYPRYPVNYTVFDAFTAKPTGTFDLLNMRLATPTYPGGREIEPELFYASNVPAGNPGAFHWFGFDEDYDYPDINNMFLAAERADGRILIPSFHRPQLVSQVARGLAKIFGVGGQNPMQDRIPLADGANSVLIEQMPWVPEWALPQVARGQNLRALTLRPRPADYDPAHMGIASPRAGRFPSLPSPLPEITQMPRPGETPNSVQFDLRLPDDIDGSGFIGDSPMELDVDTDGDGLKDAIWVDLGHPVITVGDQSFKPLFAFKVIDLDGKVNLNVHGNVFKTPNPDENQAVGYPLHHTSNYGATPAEVNPGHVFSLGDVPLTGNVSPRPVWSYQDTGANQPVMSADQTSPLKRMLVGDARTNPPAPGRWTPRTEAASGARGSAPGRFGVDDNRNAAVAYSEGDGQVIATTNPNNRYPAVQGRYSQADFRGVGRRFEPFSESAAQHAGAFGLVPGEGNVLPALLNHAAGRNQFLSTGPYGAHVANLANGSPGAANAVPTAGGLDPTLLTMDEPAEANLYDPQSMDDSFFTAAEMAALLAGQDIDESQVNNRLALLSPAQLALGVPDANDRLKGYLTQERYAKKRMRRLLTHSSWDLARFSAPPVTNPYNLLGPALASDKYAFVSPLSATVPNNPVAPFGRKHTGTVGVDRVFAMLVASVAANDIPQEFRPLFQQFQRAVQDLSTKRTADGRDTLIPREVLEGRRFDLNRPLSSYIDASTGLAVDPGRAREIDLERESFAQQIYVLLSLACGPMTGPANAGVDALIHKELRCAQGRVLAQIAVNIVDFIDPDSVMTRMEFDPDLSDGWNSTGQSAVPVEVELGLNPPPNQDQWRSMNTVFGFELPELVINEGVSVCVEEIQDPTPNQPGDEVRLEKRFVWAELFNPWPGYIDAVDGQPGVRLCKDNGESIYKIGVRDQHQSWVDSDPSLGNTNQFVLFNTQDPNDYDGILPEENPPRVLSRDPSGVDRNQGYFVVGPADPQSKILRTDADSQDLLPQDVWQPPNSGAGGNNGDNDYTATSFYRQDVVPTPNFKPIVVELKLYRLRNPYRQFDRNENPYVVLDYLRLQGNRRAISHWYMQRTGNAWQEVSNNLEVEAGAYYIPDPSNPDPPASAPPLVNNTERYSLQRRQPWHGYNSEWTPYGRTIDHPLYKDYLAQGEAYLEGLFLGLPSLADNGMIGANNPLQKYGEPEHMENAMVQNGFVPASLATSSGQVATFSRTGSGRPNVDVMHKQFLTFPFLNRQLASPLELLSVRMYGSHMWFVGNEAGADGPMATGGTIPEWRLRFTDDFEFAVRPWVPSPGTSNMPTDRPMYERVWRSRQIPWFLDSRLTHPNWPKFEPADLINAATNWDAMGDKIGGHTGPQFMAPFPHLYRFFEFVECGSRMFDGRPEGDPGRWDFSGNGTTKNRRPDRVPGKINLNTWVDQEILMGLVDSVSAMPAHPVETATAVQNFLNGGAVQASFPLTEAMWPIRYGDALTGPLGESPLGAARDYAGRLLGWGELGLSRNDALSVGNGATLPYGGMDLYAALMWQVTNPLDLLTLNDNLLNQIFSPNRQFPGSIKGPMDPLIGSTYPGTDPRHLFSSEMARTVLMSRCGPDGIMGTGDDKPFRSFAAENVNETILRQRNFLFQDFVHGGEISLITLNDAIQGGDLGSLATDPGVAQFLASTWVDGADDVYNLPNPLPSVGVGDYIVRLGGQWTPRLFDPVPDPYSSELRRMMFAVGARYDMGEQTRPPMQASDPDVPADYWMLENRRNEVLVKIANNSTTRSHVFAVWVAVGMFRVEPGTEHLKVPLLGEEVGSDVGRPVRHRAFFIVDRSKATKYDYEDIDANYELPQIDLIEYYKIME